MNDINKLIGELASETAPDEKDLAPFLLEAFLSQPDQRKVDSRRGESLGGFGSGMASELTAVLAAIQGCAKIITPLLSFATSVISLVTEVKRSRNGQVETVEDGSSAEDEKETVATALDGLKDRLIAEGYEKNKAENKSEKIIIIMMNDPETSKEFLKKLLKK